MMPPRFFVADDKFGDVIRCLEARGWTRFPHTSFPKFQLKWVNYSKIAWGSSSVERLQPAQVINHFQNAVLFSQKDVFAHALYAHECSNVGGGGDAVAAAHESPREVDKFYPRTFDLVQKDDTVLLQEWFLYSQALAIAKSYAMHGASGAAHDGAMLSRSMALLTVVIEHGAVFFSRTQRKRALVWPHITMLDVDAPQWEPLRRCRGAAAVATTSAPVVSIETSEAAIKCMLETLESLDPQFHAVGFENQNVWICKPSNLSQGRGIHLLTSLDDILALQTQDTGAQRRDDATGSEQQSPLKWVVQKYIERPLLGLQQGRKFDVRQWVLIDSLGPPLRVFWYHKCYLRFCSQPFSLDFDRLDNEFVHLSNYSVQCKSVAENAPEELPGEDSLYELMWSSDKFQAQLRAEHGRDVWSESIVPQMQHATRVAIQSTEPKLKNVGRGFEWLGLDFLLDENYRMWLLEVNVSPDVSHSTDVTANLVPKATEDLLELVLDGIPSPENGWIPLPGFAHEAQ